MRHIANEGRRFLYAPWIPAALLLALSFLIFSFWKMHAGQTDAETVLLFLVSERKYHAILYALLALFIFALDVDSGAIHAQVMAGYRIPAVILRKSALYFALVIILNMVYSAVCLLLFKMWNGDALRVILPRLLIDLGAAAIFIPLQLIFKKLQPTLVLSGVAAVAFIIADAPAYELWYAVINGAAVPAGKFLVSVIAIVALPILAALYRSRNI